MRPSNTLYNPMSHSPLHCHKDSVGVVPVTSPSLRRYWSILLQIQRIVVSVTGESATFEGWSRTIPEPSFQPSLPNHRSLDFDPG